MRFNDLMQTVLAAEDQGGPGTVTSWRQCVDLIAQHDRPDRPPLAPGERGALLDRLEALRPRLTETQRLATVVELGGRLRSPTLLHFFAQDKASICAAAVARAQLPDASWANLLPLLTPTARSVLRGRRDLGPETLRGLEAFGSVDLVLGSPDAVPAVEAEEVLELTAPIAPVLQPPSPEPEIVTAQIVTAQIVPLVQPQGGEDQIRNLVDRIERFTSARRPTEPTLSPAASMLEPAAASAPVSASGSVRAFSFETDEVGIIHWVGEGPRAALVGLSLAEPALPGGSGPDGNVAGAFGRRSGFQQGRFTIVGGAAAGEWRLSATPFFDARTGRFQGFRGQARRPHLHEVAAAPPPQALGDLPADSVRQLIHELRTPLNAILGFAEIIEQQLFGETAREYRDMAGNIVADARHLLVAFDELDMAARLSREDAVARPRAISPGLLLTQVVSRFQDDNAQLSIAVDGDLPDVMLDPVQGERMVQHLLRTVVSLARPEEPVTGGGWFQPDGAGGKVVIAVDRPASLAGKDEAQLLDPGYMPDGDWPDGPLLGLGFSLRLIRSIAAAAGGALEIDPRRFRLLLPAIAGHAEGEAGQG